jgi:hypothetical protein
MALATPPSPLPLFDSQVAAQFRYLHVVVRQYGAASRTNQRSLRVHPHGWNQPVRRKTDQA